MPDVSVKNLSAVDTIVVTRSDGNTTEIAPLGRQVFDLDNGGPITTSVKDPIEEVNDNGSGDDKSKVFEKAKVEKKSKSAKKSK